MVDTFFKRYTVEIGIGVLLTVIFFLTRILTISQLPIFTDEAIYLRWAQIANNDANWRFISLTDGKQPLFIWLMMIMMRFVTDPIVAGRLISVGAGFFTALGLFFLGREIFRHYWVGILSATLYVFYSFAMVYDRMALYDSLVGTFAVWGLYLVILLVRRIRLETALLLGMTMGASVLNKSNGFFTIYLLPISLLLFPWRDEKRWSYFIKWVLLVGIATVMTYTFYSMLRLSPYFYLIAEKNTIFIYPFREWITHPFRDLYSNLVIGEMDWLLKYFTIPFIIVSIASFFVDKTNLKEKILLLLWFIAPFVALGLFGKTIYPRYIFFMTLSLLPLVAYTIWAVYLRYRKLLYVVLLMLFAVSWQLVSDYFILFDFANAPIPISDRAQYNNDWPAGVGVKESIAFFEKQAQNGPIFVATQGTFGLMPASYELYLNNNKNITVKGFWPIGDIIPEEARQKARAMPTYFVFYQPCIVCPGKGIAPKTWNVKPVLIIQKVAQDAQFIVYQVPSK